MPYDDDNYTISAAPPAEHKRIIPYSTPGGGGGYMYADGSPVIMVNPDGTPTAHGRRLLGLESPEPRIKTPRSDPNALRDQVMQIMKNSGNPGNPMLADQPGQHYLQASPVNQPQVEVVNVKPPMRLTSMQNPSAGIKQSAQPDAPMQTQSDLGGGNAMYYDDDDYKTDTTPQMQPSMPSSMLTQPPTGPSSSRASSAGTSSSRAYPSYSKVSPVDPSITRGYSPSPRISVAHPSYTRASSAGTSSSRTSSAGSGSGQTGPEPLYMHTKDPKAAERVATSLTNYEAIKAARELLDDPLTNFTKVIIPGVGVISNKMMKIPENREKLRVVDKPISLPPKLDTGYNAQYIYQRNPVSSPAPTHRVLNLKPSNAPMQTQSDFGGGDTQSSEPLEMPWDYHEDPIAWLNRRAAEMYRREEA